MFLLRATTSVVVRARTMFLLRATTSRCGAGEDEALFCVRGRGVGFAAPSQ
jgi:hypothetical protein